MNVSGFVTTVAYILVFLGAFNWGLIGVFDYNLIATVFGTGAFTTALYVIIGLSAVYTAYVFCVHCKSCKSK